MEDTSFAIHPGKKNEIEGTNYQDVGNFISLATENERLMFKCEHGFVNVEFNTSSIVRIVMNPKTRPKMKTSPAVVKERDSVSYRVNETNEGLTVQSDELTLQIEKHPFRIKVSNNNGKTLVNETIKGLGSSATGEVVCFKDMDKNDHFYGFGEKTGFLDKKGDKLTMWNSDVYAPHNPETDPLYQSIPFFMTLRDEFAFGTFFDNTGKTFFDMRDQEGTYEFRGESGQLDYYIFAGPTMKEVLKQYTSLTGKMPLPPKWALGYHQSRYSYETEEEVRELVHNFLEKEIPVDAIYLDIHYMDGYRVFTFDNDRYPNPKKLIQDLRDQGIRVVPIVDPGVKEDPEYDIYKEGVKNDFFCKYIEGNIYFGDVWPGNSAFPDFTNEYVRNWWGEKHRFYSDLGIEGIWNDMNEPAVFNETKTMDTKVMHDNEGDPKTHRELHNLYGLMMGEATYEGMKKQLDGKRTFLLTRAGYAGVQRYGSVWTGDNRSFWEHLHLALPMCMNLGLSGVAFCGPDVGGFAHDSNGQLLARWTQFGTFTPYFRNHSAIGTARQEPWSFGEDIEEIVKNYIQLRYVWMPQLYRLFKEAHETGVPVMRPLVLEYPEDKKTFNLCDQFMIGENVIVAPIMTPDTEHRVVYLPEGNWIDYWTEERLTGGEHHLVHADIETLPIFIKENSAVAHGAIKTSTDQQEENYQIHLYKASKGKATYNVYEDDGKTFEYETGNVYENELTFTYNDNFLEVTTNRKGRYTPDWKAFTLVIHGKDQLEKVLLDGEDITSIAEEKAGNIIIPLKI
ncbi:glycoside hydrolase family 31 protein [Bacillus shivajii]|uniref:glycoside hydrolase family 31 protein n=1 Tax=Bacillus shivajii TaxID=1983719 RepID=UPI001CF97733|nr:glycoside hydrolase family 31 protein [Bacillus shivajii]UCZ52016.1 glycoside hydrolase family 31 protein [Bacillus shivajii]